MSLTRSKQNNQKLVYNRENAMNSTGDVSVVGLFKSTSSLAQSILKGREVKKDRGPIWRLRNAVRAYK
jgi:hypothetical protein